jgi:hypothetical protein
MDKSPWIINKQKQKTEAFHFLVKQPSLDNSHSENLGTDHFNFANIDKKMTWMTFHLQHVQCSLCNYFSSIDFQLDKLVKTCYTGTSITFCF